MTFKTRIVRRYSPYGGTWYVLKIRLFFVWFTLPKIYGDSVLAEQALNDIHIMFSRRITETIIKESETEVYHD